MPEKVKQEATNFIVGLVFPFLQRDWPVKLWIFWALSYVPVVGFIVARGWRLDLIHRIAWDYDRVLPEVKALPRHFIRGLVLWLITAAYLAVPGFIIVYLGLGGVYDLYQDILQIFTMLREFLWEGTRTPTQLLVGLWDFTINEIVATIGAVLIENIYLFIYIPDTGSR
ncbi:MAG: hypothetical protein AAFZ18_35855 [Myxococcota bacterium]